MRFGLRGFSSVLLFRGVFAKLLSAALSVMFAGFVATGALASPFTMTTPDGLSLPAEYPEAGGWSLC